MRNFYTLIFIILLGLNYNSTAATFSSVASGTWSAPATWTITAGTDSDGVPDGNDDVTVSTNHTVTINSSSVYAKTFVNNGVVRGGNAYFWAYGSFTNNGQFTQQLFSIYVMSSCILSSTTAFNGTQTIDVNSGNLTIAANTTVNLSSNLRIRASRQITNNGSLSVLGTISTFSSSIFTNGVNSTLTLSRNIPSTGTFNFSSVNNTVVFNSSMISQIKGTTYYNLTVNASSTKTVTGSTVIGGNLTINSGTVNLNNNNLSVAGNWSNNANTNILNQGTITFNGTGTQSISRSATESFNNVVLSGTSTVNLGTSISISQNLSINSGTLDVSASNFTLNVGGNIVNNGGLNLRSGLVNLNGTALQSLSGSSGFQFYALTLNNSGGTIINSTSTVSDVLTVTNGNFNSNGNVTLTSDASKTARLGVVGSGGSFTGNMIIQKHIPTRTGSWTDFSSPTQGTTIFDWDNEMYMSGFSMQDTPAGIAGVDGSAGGFKSVKTYNEPTAAYANVTNSATVLNPGKGYEIWLADALNGNWNAKTIDSRGVPNFGTQNISLSFSGSAGAYAGLNLVGNPFASVIDYSLINKTNTDGHAYGYNNGVWTDFGTNAILTPHQGFWVYATGAGASISVPENAKSTSTSTSFFRTVPNYAIKLMYINSDIEFYNEAKVNIEDKASEKWDIELDAIYFNSPEAQASTINFNTGTRKLLTNAVNDKQENITLPIELFSPKVGLYYIQPSVLNIGEYKFVWIENTKTGEKFDLNRSIPVNIDKTGENNDFVLRLSKTQESSQISQAVFANDLMIFNSENNLNLKSNSSNHQLSQISVFDLSGKLVFEQKDITIEENSTYKFDISSLNQGVYIVNVIDVNGNSISKKIMK